VAPFLMAHGVLQLEVSENASHILRWELQS